MTDKSQFPAVNRRRFRRYPLPWPVTISPDSGHDQPRPESPSLGHVFDAGLGGLGVMVTDNPPPVGQELNLTLDCLTSGRVKAKGKVKWRSEAKAKFDQPKVGIQFTSMNLSDWEVWFSVCPGL